MREYKTNAVTTELTESYLKSLTKEEKETMLEYISSIVFLQNIVSVDRPYARDLERWDSPNNEEKNEDGTDVRSLKKDGKIRVDLANPHILENVDFFREPAIHFETHGVYTFLKPDNNPYGDYRKFWNAEIVKCWEGMFREEDGEWITGYHYFYLNYSPIRKSIKTKGSKSKRVNRAVGLPDFYDGDYWFFHYIERARENGKHCGGLKKRGAGYSLKGAAMMGRNFIVGESREVSSEVVSLAIANEKEYLTKDGILNKFVDVLNHNGKTTPFPNRRELKDSFQSMHWQLGWKNNSTGITEGSQNEVIGVTLKNDPEKARGKRAQFILWEEFGKFKDSIKAWNIGRPSVEDGEDVFGQMCFWGTGGTATESFTGLRTLFYKPEVYGVYALANVWDKNAKPGATCAFFHPGYLNQRGYMDANGNSDVVGSLISVIKKRMVIKYNASESSTLPQMMAEMALTPQEAIMKVSGSIFPTVDIGDYLEDCRTNLQKFVSTHNVGDLVIKADGSIEFKTNFDKVPIRRYMEDKSDVEGAFEMYAYPQINPHTKMPYEGRYIVGIDPVDNDYVLTGSLASAFVFDLWNDEIVAEYTGRPTLAEDFYEICRRMILYYNAKANYENNIKGLFGYFNNKSCLNLLCDTPTYLRDVEQQRINLIGNAAKGTRATAGINADAIRLQKTWLLSPKEYVNELGEEVKTINLRTIRSLGYLEELYEFNSDGNFDRVSAMGMVMILRQEMFKLTERRTSVEEAYVEEDSFIRDNYDKYLKNDDTDTATFTTSMNQRLIKNIY